MSIPPTPEITDRLIRLLKVAFDEIKNDDSLLELLGKCAARWIVQLRQRPKFMELLPKAGPIIIGYTCGHNLTTPYSLKSPTLAYIAATAISADFIHHIIIKARACMASTRRDSPTWQSCTTRLLILRYVYGNP